MQRIISTLILLIVIALLPAISAKAGFFGDDTLVTIDGTEYTDEDFKRWWGFWQEVDMELPETPDFYIDWLLLSREGRNMELDTAPGFARGTRIFLQSRTLLKLKYDEIDSQIKVTETDIKNRYEEKFLPRYLLEGMEFADEATASTAWQELSDKKVTVSDLIARDAESGGPVKTAEMTLRAGAIEKKWKNTYKDLSAGDVLDPNEGGKSKVLWYLKEVKGSDKEDFASLHESISKDLWKEQEAALTRALVAELRVKYAVKVDEERLVAIDLKADPSTWSDEPVISSSKQNYSEKEFVAVMERLFKSRPMLKGALMDPEALQQLMKDTAYNVIAQSVTNWESIDRRYEEIEPFKWEYEFNYNHRLVLELQQRLFSAQAVITDEEAEQDYQQYKSRYSVPERVQLYIVDETQGPIDKVWADVAAGMNFDKAVKAHLENYPGLQEIPSNHLDPEVKPVVAELADGETSQIFTAQGIRVFVHLAKRYPENAIPFEKVKNSIRQGLYQEKIAQLQDEYLKQIKANSVIEVEDDEWEEIQEELGGA